MTSSITARRWAWAFALSFIGCRFGYEETELGDGELVGPAGGASSGTSASSDGTGLEGGAPGDSGSTAGSGATGGTSGASDVGGAPGTGGSGGTGADAGAGGGGGTPGSGGGAGLGGALGSGGVATTVGGSGGASTTTAGGSGGASTTASGSGGATTTTAGSGGSGGGTAPDMTQCVQDSYGGHDYLLCAERRTWPGAASGCQIIGMRLVRVDDLAENQWLDVNRNVTGPGSPPNVWIGASDQAVEDEWRWTDGDLFWSGDHLGMPENGLFANWYDREPNDIDLAQDEDCGSMGNNRAEWFDSACDQLYPYICESL